MSELEEEYRLDYFEESGFHRMECPECGDAFWTRDGDRETCGEPPCDSYGFIDDPGFEESHTLAEMREAFLSFFEQQDHERLDPVEPVYLPPVEAVTVGVSRARRQSHQSSLLASTTPSTLPSSSPPPIVRFG